MQVHGALEICSSLLQRTIRAFRQETRPRVFDCFMFNDELDILEVRLSELFNVVDVFVLIEATFSHRGNSKPLHYHENARRFARYSKKVKNITVRSMPAEPERPFAIGKVPLEEEEHWLREGYQRNVLRDGIAAASPNDLIIVSDVDEIPSVNAIRQALTCGRFVFLDLMLNYYYLNLCGGRWMKAYAAPKAVIDQMGDLSRPRWREAKYLDDIRGSLDSDVIRNAGWHFTWQGGAEKIIGKIDSACHLEFEAFKDRALLERAMAERRFFIGDVPLREVPVRNLPETVQARLSRFEGYLAPASKRTV
jgi:hypothetical protein